MMLMRHNGYIVIACKTTEKQLIAIDRTIQILMTKIIIHFKFTSSYINRIINCFLTEQSSTINSITKDSLIEQSIVHNRTNYD